MKYTHSSRLYTCMTLMINCCMHFILGQDLLTVLMKSAVKKGKTYIHMQYVESCAPLYFYRDIGTWSIQTMRLSI